MVDRSESNSEPSTVKRRTHRSTVVRACPVCCTIALIASPCRCSCTSSERCCAVRRTMREPVKLSSVAESERQPRTCPGYSLWHTTMSVGMDNTTKTINQPLVRKRSKTTLGEVVGRVGIFVKTTSSQTNPHTASATQPLEGLKHAVRVAWTEVMTEEYCTTLADSMDARLRKLRKLRGAHTGY